MPAREVTMIPGTLCKPTFPLTRYRPHQVSGHLRSVIQSVTEPGEIVLELNTIGSSFVYEALTSDRRILSQNIDPIAMLITHIELNPVDVMKVRSALFRLADSSKGNQTLMTHIQEQYRSNCPDCAQQGVAFWFAWDRDTQQPFYKCVHCSNCGSDREGPADESDILVKNLNPTAGLAYNVALERAAAHNESIRSRISELVSLYTARNLSALMDIIHRLPNASPSPNIRRVISAFVIDALDKGSSLVPYDNVDARPKSLKPPQLFLEYNIWDLMESAMRQYASQMELGRSAHNPADSFQSFINNNQGYILIANTLPSVVSRLTDHRIKLAILHPEIPDVVYKALSSLWSTWLWKSDRLPSAFRAFMGRRRIDQEWHQRNLISILQDIQPSLHPDAVLFCPTSNNSLQILQDILEATRSTGFSVKSWLDTGTEGYRFIFETGTSSRISFPTPPQEHYAMTLELRGEPCTLRQLKAAYMIEEPGATIDRLPTQLSTIFSSIKNTELIWLQDDRNASRPLADRVEELTLQLLQKQPSWTRDKLEDEIYTQFNGLLSPEPELVNICINAYTVTDAAGHTLSLRPEDTPKTRRNELKDSRTKIEQLGIRLGFSVTRRLNSDILWKQPDKVPYLFRFSSTALLTPHFMNVSRARTSERRCLVLPGGRASLVALKLRRDPRLDQAILRDNWVFIKFRHLRRMLSEITNRGEIDFYLGLDPIVEMDSAQIPLPLE